MAACVARREELEGVLECWAIFGCRCDAIITREFDAVRACIGPQRSAVQAVVQAVVIEAATSPPRRDTRGGQSDIRLVFHGI